MDQLLLWVQVGGGLALLFVSAEVLVRGAVVLAWRLGLSSLIIGLTVTAAGTSAHHLPDGGARRRTRHCDGQRHRQ